MDFAAVAELCAPGVASETLKSIASVESSFNPYAIGVVGARLQRQPRNISEALATASLLRDQGYDYSLGLVQVNQKNFASYGLTPEAAFDPCTNLRIGSFIFQDCYRRAGAASDVLGDALSCYYSGNFTTGYRLGYVAKVKAAAIGNPVNLSDQAIPVIATPKLAKGRAVSKPPPRFPEPLFVTAATPPVLPVAETVDQTPPLKSQESALLF